MNQNISSVPQRINLWRINGESNIGRKTRKEKRYHGVEVPADSHQLLTAG